MAFSKLLLLHVAMVAAMCGTSLAQDATCPTRYSDEQISIIGHSAYIGVAGDYCPNLRRNAQPLLSFLATAWGKFPSTEFECNTWRNTYEQSEGRAALQIITNGLKGYCETSIRLYGPNGTLLKNALTFSTPP